MALASQRLAFGTFEVDSKNLAEAILFGEEAFDDELTSQSSSSNASTQAFDPALMAVDKERFSIPRIVTVEAPIPATPVEISTPKEEAVRAPPKEAVRQPVLAEAHRTIPSIATIAEMAPILLKKPQLKQARRRSSTALPDWWMERMAADRAKTAKRRASWHAVDPAKKKESETKARRHTIAAVAESPPVKTVELKAYSSGMEILISPLKGEVTIVKQEGQHTTSSLGATNPPVKQLAGTALETASTSPRSSDYETATEEVERDGLGLLDGSCSTPSTISLVMESPAQNGAGELEDVGILQRTIETKPAEDQFWNLSALSSGTQDTSASTLAEAAVETAPQDNDFGGRGVPRIEGDAGIAVAKPPILFQHKSLMTGTLHPFKRRDVSSNHAVLGLVVVFCAVLWDILRLI